ncbi:MAG: hypothetical protein ACRD8Z_06415, partial [Nitrososphaeraceae archaeon]
MMMPSTEVPPSLSRASTLKYSFVKCNAYDSGQNHVCDDADKSDPDDIYINQPGKGPSFHTGAFMDG